MFTVTERIRNITQPSGGYIKLSDFDTIRICDPYTLGEENIHRSLIGLAVDYLTRTAVLRKQGKSLAESLEIAFEISLLGYEARHQYYGLAEDVILEDIRRGVDPYELLSQIKGLDDASIIVACKLVSYDVWYRNLPIAVLAKGAKDINPDKQTIENIKNLVRRCALIFQMYGPVIKTGFTFEGGYTDTISSGDGDYLTKDTLWDIKVSKAKPTSKDTLQVLVYWIMGQRSKKKAFKNISKIGIFNPRLNIAYILDVNKIEKFIIQDVERYVIGYDDYEY